MNREKFTQGKRWVVKVGSSLVTNDGLGLDRMAIADWARQLVRLKSTGTQLVLVSSGAVAAIVLAVLFVTSIADTFYQMSTN